jgi:hypothetical protein
VLTLRSNVELANETELPLEIKFQLELTNEEKFVTIPPRERLPVPIAFAAHGALQVRPHGFGFKWSEIVRCGNLSAKAGKKTFLGIFQEFSGQLLCAAEQNEYSPHVYSFRVTGGRNSNSKNLHE